ncbi:Phosphoenolpyruvate-protein phosphotransferase [Moraxella lacunata]|uniref:phosphoenolpyruvate--protein phosphotransferase n=1 Tax=Moraxella lacunata TaxID=477 RepID=A0A378T5A4_MORLA|nr:phosphoenolpyruvate--protein phosphotransferase [Moraxella lacunata]STZ55969.1 Phosphoenolpyruvate-protein phosphotransferase [Moraxella lacunata]
MLNLTATDVRMNAQATNKDEALSLLAKILSEDGLATADYLAGLQAREAQTSTYLGQGIAIPHGTPESRACVQQTGVRLVHFADGVVWNDDGERAYLLVGICAKSDEHLSILRQLTKALGDDIEGRIKHATSADELLAILDGTGNRSLSIHENLIKTDINAKDADELYEVAVSLLKQQGKLVSATGIRPSFTKLSEAIYCATLEHDELVAEPAFALAVAKGVVKLGHDDMRALAVIASNQTVNQDKLLALYDVLLSAEFGGKLQHASLPELVTFLGADKAEHWQSASVVLPNAHGLHARPATALSELAKGATGELKVAVDNGAYVSAKSLTKLLSLGATRGQSLTFIAEPNTDATEYLPKLIQAVQDGLGEEVTPIGNSQANSQESGKANHEPAVLDLTDNTAIIKGERTHATSASAGLAHGEAFVVRQVRFDYPVQGGDKASEWASLQQAIGSVKDELKAIVQTAKKASIAQIFTAHVALLDDEEVTHGAKDGIDDGLSAAAAWHAHIEQLAKVQASVANHLLAERAADLRDVGQKVLAKLTGQAVATEPAEPYVLIKEDLLPSDVARLDPARVAGILTAVGGASSHSAIVARALGIPAIVGAGKGVLDVNDGERVLIDGGQGWFVVAPTDEMVAVAKAEQASWAERKRLASETALNPAITQDGHQVEIAVNLGNVHDTKMAVESGAEAVGLLRTELVFMSHQSVPDIDTQVMDYTQVFDALDGRPLVVRTLDVGGDKPLPYLPMPFEDNPFLGVRGIRLTLRQPALLENQLIALIKASKGRDLRIMFPMVGRLEEWHDAKAILDKVLSDYPHDKLQVGMMIEVPSAAVMADIFASEVDFFSIGTNDLTQYALAIDRGHATLSKDADGLHPSVLRLIQNTVANAHAHGKWVGVCGELAGDERAIPILVGLGVDELSMSAGNIALAKAVVRELNFADCGYLAKKALSCRTAGEVRALVMGV